ncbi:hypothetical protein FB45DRAFT_889558 [Roridomyces roridus]|uniref:Uncharacterized protein n=1 Tax=Roridomyces roridus TaxID=1738132 RepID=A0AAD7G2T4_9AGAR|nr:hypothetical protein FB45DRAFT_889558 [Roridomyces roridus]
MSTRSSSPTAFDSDDGDYSALMSVQSPLPSPARKRTSGDAGLDEEEEEDDSSTAARVVPNGNHLQNVSAYAARKRLRHEQIAEIETFLGDPAPVQRTKLFIDIKSLENQLAKFQAAKPKFEVNSDLKTNLTWAVNAALCSPNITQYKGEDARNDIVTLLTRHHWGNFVVGTENDSAAMDVVVKCIGDIFTQSRSTMKKEIVASVETKRAKNLTRPPALRSSDTHTTVYQLTKTVARKLSGGKTISIPVTPALCARIALIRKWHVKKLKNKLSPEDQNKGLWELVDQDLKVIRTKAREDTEDPTEIAKRVARAFTNALDKDRKAHGLAPAEQIPALDPSTDAALLAYQADIDETIEARNRGQTVSTTTASKGDDGDEEEEEQGGQSGGREDS